MNLFFYLFLFFIIILTLLILRIIYRKYIFKHQNYITSNTIILITGGCHGIGRALITYLLTNYKCTILNIDICKEKFSLLEACFNTNKSKQKAKLINYHCDLSDINQINACLSAILSENKIDILINNAGVSYNQYFNELESKKFMKTINTNLIAPMLITKRLLEEESNKNMHIVNIASVMSHITACKSTDYTSSKWGLYAFHECLRYDYYHKNNICFTVVCPYAVNTAMFEGFVSPLPFVEVMNVDYVAEIIVKSIVLKDKIVYIPFYMEYIALVFKILPCFIRDFLYFKFSKRFYFI
jgi:uncharacterized protein